MTISKADFCFFITELVRRNPNLGIPAVEDGLFANLLIFDYLCYIFSKRKGKGKRKREGKRKRKKGREEGRGNHLYCSEGEREGQTPLQNCSGW